LSSPAQGPGTRGRGARGRRGHRPPSSPFCPTQREGGGAVDIGRGAALPDAPCPSGSPARALRQEKGVRRMGAARDRAHARAWGRGGDRRKDLPFRAATLAPCCRGSSAARAPIPASRGNHHTGCIPALGPVSFLMPAIAAPATAERTRSWCRPIGVAVVSVALGQSLRRPNMIPIGLRHGQRRLSDLTGTLACSVPGRRFACPCLSTHPGPFRVTSPITHTSRRPAVTQPSTPLRTSAPGMRSCAVTGTAVRPDDAGTRRRQRTIAATAWHRTFPVAPRRA